MDAILKYNEIIFFKAAPPHMSYVWKAQDVLCGVQLDLMLWHVSPQSNGPKPNVLHRGQTWMGGSLEDIRRRWIQVNMYKVQQWSVHITCAILLLWIMCCDKRAITHLPLRFFALLNTGNIYINYVTVYVSCRYLIFNCYCIFVTLAQQFPWG